MEEKVQETIQSVEPIIEVQNPKSNLKYALLGGLGVLVIGAAVFAGIVIGQKKANSNARLASLPTSTPEVSPTPDSTSDRKTYTNSQYDFSIKYPSTWQTNPLPVGEGILIGVDGPNDDQISITVSNQADSVKTGECQEILLDTAKATRCELTQTISTERGVIHDPPIISKTINVFTAYSGRFYKISITDNELSEKFNIFDQILSTFKFLD